MKNKALGLVAAMILAGCGGGGGGDEPPVAAAPPPPSDKTPAPAPPPAGSPPPVAQPPAAPPPVATPPVATPPPAAEPPPVAEPPAVEPPPPPPSPPVDTRPKIKGAHFAYMMSQNTNGFRGPDLLSRVGDTDSQGYGLIFAGGNTAGGSHNFGTGYYARGNNPYYSFPTVWLFIPASYQDGHLWYGDTMSADYGYGNDLKQMVFKRSTPFEVQPDDQLVMNTTIAQWDSINKDEPYYMQLQTGDWEGFYRQCWHMRLPGILRQECTLWRTNPEWVVPQFAGHYVSDDSGSGKTVWHSVRN